MCGKDLVVELVETAKSLPRGKAFPLIKLDFYSPINL